MNKATLDLRVNARLVLQIDEGVSYQPSINGLNALDSEYSLTFPSKTYTVANGGLALEESTKSIVINILEDDFEQGNHQGVLVSESKQAGIYFKMTIDIECYANS